MDVNNMMTNAHKLCSLAQNVKHRTELHHIITLEKARHHPLCLNMNLKWNLDKLFLDLRTDDTISHAWNTEIHPQSRSPAGARVVRVTRVDMVVMVVMVARDLCWWMSSVGRLTACRYWWLKQENPAKHNLSLAKTLQDWKSNFEVGLDFPHHTSTVSTGQEIAGRGMGGGT